jgi:4'-phosphopantetheinyl transferase
VVELPEGEVHLWFAYPDEWEERALIESARAILDAGEIARSEPYHFPAHRQLFLLSRLLLRTTLSRYADVPPGAWRFVTNEHGKPRVAREAGRPAPSFNIAHTAGVAVAAVTSGREVGVDVESRSRHVQAERVTARFFASEEAAELGKLSYAEIRRRFFLTWTLKEAYTKALGRGFAQPFDSFSFRLTKKRPHRIAFSAPPGQDPSKWRFAVVEPRPRFNTGLCVAAGPAESLRLRCYRALPADGSVPLICKTLALSEGWDVFSPV